MKILTCILVVYNLHVEIVRRLNFSKVHLQSHVARVSGLSPFMGDNDSETLVSVTMAQWDFDDDTFDEISDDAKNYIEKLLVKDMR